MFSNYEAGGLSELKTALWDDKIWRGLYKVYCVFITHQDTTAYILFLLNFQTRQLNQLMILCIDSLLCNFFWTFWKHLCKILLPPKINSSLQKVFHSIVTLQGTSKSWMNFFLRVRQKIWFIPKKMSASGHPVSRCIICGMHMSFSCKKPTPNKDHHCWQTLGTVF